MEYALSGVKALVFLAAIVAVVVVGGRLTRKIEEPRERAVRWLTFGLVAAIPALFGLSLVGATRVSTFFAMFTLLLIGAAALYWIDQLLDCLTSPPRQDDERVIWVIVILLLVVIGAFLYQMVGRERLRPAQAGDGEAKNIQGDGVDP